MPIFFQTKLALAAEQQT
jgi:signal transduction histidine kinase